MALNPSVEEQLEILRRLAERGLSYAEENNDSRTIDLWLHTLNNIELTFKYHRGENMSSSYDSGYYNQVAGKIEKSKCESKKSIDKKHDWKEMGQWPSMWKQCEHCKETIFYK